MQLVNGRVIENVFSLCFGTVEGEGAMLLGDAPLPPDLSLEVSGLVFPVSGSAKKTDAGMMLCALIQR